MRPCEENVATDAPASEVAERSVEQPATARLVGLDVARCLALLGMVATHVLDGRDADGGLTATQWLAGGRASALFAVLLGISLALVTGGREHHRGVRLGRDAAGLVVRAVLVAALGLALGDLETGIAVILAYYGVVMLLALPFLAVPGRWLLVLAVAWALIEPVVSQIVRPLLPQRQFASPALDQVADPGRLLAELTFTGYYPALGWLAYALLGIGLGRVDLRRTSVAVRLLGVGLVVAVGATLLSRLLTARAGFSAQELDGVSTGMFGQTPIDDGWRWLLVVAPHSTSPFDLVQTGGSALAVIGTCLLLVAGLRRSAPAGERVVAVLFGAGTATLSLYSLHVVMRTEEVWPAEEPASLRWHLLVLLWIGAVLVALGRRGPLEAVVGFVPRLVAGRRSRTRSGGGTLPHRAEG